MSILKAVLTQRQVTEAQSNSNTRFVMMRNLQRITLFLSALTSFGARHVALSQSPSVEISDGGDVALEAEESINTAAASGTDGIGTLLTIVVVIIVAVFLWNVIQLVIRTKEDDVKQRAQGNALKSIVALVLFASLWGAAAFLKNLTGFENKTPSDQPAPITLPNVYNQ